MLQEIIPFLASSDSALGDASRSTWTSQMQEIKGCPASASERFLDHFAEEPCFATQPYGGETGGLVENKKREVAAIRGHSLFQESFFFCRVKKVGDLPGAECIYVETVVDRDSGLPFAKVYPTKSALNAIDILETRVMPFFEVAEFRSGRFTPEKQANIAACSLYTRVKFSFPPPAFNTWKSTRPAGATTFSASNFIGFW